MTRRTRGGGFEEVDGADVPASAEGDEMELSGAVLAQCPYCGEEVELTVDPVGVAAEEYVEDCPVCCRPWTVRVSREGEDVDVQLSRDDD